jgi:putative sterol carrier protein
MDVAQIFAQMPEAFQAERAGDLKAQFQFNITGEGGGNWSVSISDGACAVVEEEADEPNIIIGMAADDFIEMIEGELQPVVAFMQGKIKLQGDMNLALRLQEVFDW